MQHSKTNSATALHQETTARRPWGRYLVLPALLFLLIWLGLKGWQIGRVVRSLQSYQAEAEAMMAGGLPEMNAADVEQMVLGMHRDVLILKAETAVFMPLMPYLGWVPKVGPTLLIAPDLMEMADAGTETAAFAVRGLIPGLTILQNDDLTSDEQLSQLVAVLDAAKPDLNQAGLSLQRVRAARAAITTEDDQPWRIKSLLQLADTWLPPAQDGLKFSLVAPQMLGIAGPKQYLIIAQNEDELRPTGGFLTGAGVLALDNGRILSLNFEDSYKVDDFTKPYGDPPAPLYDFMTLDLFVFRDANFWPDFPTSANKAMELYSYGRDLPPLDGVIAMDQRFLQLLLQGTGPVSLPDSDIILNSNNVINTLQASWELGEGEDVAQWAGQRKSFLGDFAQAILQKVQADFAGLNPIQLAQSSYEALQTKRLQIYVRDPQVAAVLDTLNWDGRLENPTQQDYLMVVDTNMGYNKANVYLERSWQYEVDLTTAVSPQANLTITYHHTGIPGEETCRQGDVGELFWEAPSYLELADQCYWNYLRVYTPQGSELIQSTNHAIAGDRLVSENAWHGETESIAELAGWQTFSNFITVLKAGSATVGINYSLPATVIQPVVGQQEDDSYHYRLQLQKQAGTNPESITVTILLPENADILTVTPLSANVQENQVTYHLNLTTDTNLSITYR